VSLTRLGFYKVWGENPERAWKTFRLFVAPISRLLAPGAGYGGERVPATGGVVLASNHFAGIDPSLIGAYCPRVVYYMAKIELLSVPIVGEFLHWTGAFAVRRGEGDRDSIRVARWLAAHGHVVGMFMEGTRQKFGYPGPVHPGAVMVAMQEDVPIVPCGIDSFGWSPLNRRPCAVVFGDPIRLEGIAKSGSGYKEGAAIVEKEVHRLWRLAAQAVHDDIPDELPDGTRRSAHVYFPSGVEDPSLEPWPTDSWAEGPLGPVYRAVRT
jgi:1-acyl-sn-glycerol-3-phosphate acyltransferase